MPRCRYYINVNIIEILINLDCHQTKRLREMMRQVKTRKREDGDLTMVVKYFWFLPTILQVIPVLLFVLWGAMTHRSCLRRCTPPSVTDWTPQRSGDRLQIKHFSLSWSVLNTWDWAFLSVGSHMLHHSPFPETAGHRQHILTYELWFQNQNITEYRGK